MIRFILLAVPFAVAVSSSPYDNLSREELIDLLNDKEALRIIERVNAKEPEDRYEACVRCTKWEPCEKLR